MPPKAKFTKEQIVDAAVELTREQGIEALTARALGARLGSSPRPIFTVFSSMEEVQAEVYHAAQVKFETYMHYSAEDRFAFRNIGMSMIRFAVEEPELFRLLHLSDQNKTHCHQKVADSMSALKEQCYEIICRKYELNMEAAQMVFENVWIHTLGLCTMHINGMCTFSEAALKQIMWQNLKGMLLLAKSGEYQWPNHESESKETKD